MDPMTAILAGQVIGGLVQAYNSRKAQGAADAELAKMRQLFESIVPPNYDLTIDSPPRLHMQAIQSPQFAAAVQSPSFDMRKLSPEKLQQVGQYAPEIAPLIQEIAPTTIQQSDTMKTGRDAQMRALDKLMKVGSGDFDPEYAQKVDEAGRAAQQEAQSRQATLMDSFARRGIGGSGLELAAAMGSNAQAMDRVAAANQQSATDAYRNQLNALAQGADLGGNLFAQDQNLQQTNANIINSFNQRMSQARQTWENQRASEMNAAQVRNLSEQQRIADANVNNANEASRYNQGRVDDLSKFNFGAAMDNQKRADDLAKYTYGRQVDERNYQNDISKYLADWKQNQKQNQNALKGQMYNDQLNRAQGLAGVYKGNAQNILQAGADKNAAISGIAGGLTNVGMNYYNKQEEAQRRKEDQDFAQKMAANYGYYTKG